MKKREADEAEGGYQEYQENRETFEGKLTQAKVLKNERTRHLHVDCLSARG